MQMPMPRQDAMVFQCELAVGSRLARRSSRISARQGRRHYDGGDRHRRKAQASTNTTTRSRDNGETADVPDFFGLETAAGGIMPAASIHEGDRLSSDQHRHRRGQRRPQGKDRAARRRGRRPGPAQRQLRDRRPSGSARELRGSRVSGSGVIRPEDVSPRQLDQSQADRRGPHLLRRPRSAHRCPAAALRPAGRGHGLAVLTCSPLPQFPRGERLP